MNFKIGDIVICRDDTLEGLGKIYDIELFDQQNNFYNILVVFDEYTYIHARSTQQWIDSYIWTHVNYLSHASSLEKELF